MMNHNIWIKIANIADTLDKQGFFKEADDLDSVLRTAQYYVNPGVVPIDDRMIPGDEVFPEAEESEQLRMKNMGRYRVPEYSSLPGGDNPASEKGNNIFNMDGTDNIDGFAQVDEFPSPSMDGNTKAYEWDNYRGENSQPPYTKLMPRG
jgi:hypothetical protein